MIYTVFDLIEDIVATVKLDKPVVIIDYDDLLVKIYLYRKRSIGLDTIRTKLRQLKRLGAIKVVQKRDCSSGICYSTRAKIYIIRSVILNLRGDLTRELPQRSLIEFLSE